MALEPPSLFSDIRKRKNFSDGWSPPFYASKSIESGDVGCESEGTSMPRPRERTRPWSDRKSQVDTQIYDPTRGLVGGSNASQQRKYQSIAENQGENGEPPDQEFRDRLIGENVHNHPKTHTKRTHGKSTVSTMQKSSWSTIPSAKSRHVWTRASKSLGDPRLSDTKNIHRNGHLGSNQLRPDPLATRITLPEGISALQGARSENLRSFARSTTPCGPDRPPWDRERGVLATQKLTSASHFPRNSKKGVLCSVRDYIRVTTPSQHGQTAYSRENIRAFDSIPKRQWAGPCTPLSRCRLFLSIDHERFPALDLDGTGYTSCQRTEVSEAPGRDDSHSRYTNDGIPIYDAPLVSLNAADKQNDHGMKTIRVVQESPKRLLTRIHTVYSENSAKRRCMINDKDNIRPHARLEDLSLPPITTPLEPVLRNAKSLKTARSAALSSLLTIAASEGIARPVEIYGRQTSTHSLDRTTSDIPKVSVWSNTCVHRAERYKPAGPSMEEKFAGRRVSNDKKWWRGRDTREKRSLLEVHDKHYITVLCDSPYCCSTSYHSGLGGESDIVRHWNNV